MNLVDDAIKYRELVFGDDVNANFAIERLQSLYVNESLAENRNCITETLIGQAIIARLYGNFDLSDQVIKEAYRIKNKQSEKRANKLKSISLEL